MSLLYEAESKGVPASSVVDELPVRPTDYTITLVEGVDHHQAEVDALLIRFSKGWALDRMPALDRAVLRMAAYELLGQPDVPTGVVLSEAVELATTYSTEDSGRFVNGLLARIAREVRAGPG